jgi:hypothetical protein
MDTQKRAELVRLYIRLQRVTDSLHAKPDEVYEMGKELEDLTKETAIRYAGLRMRVEAKAALKQAEELRRVLEELGERLSE